MSIREFKNNVNLIIKFIARVNEESVPTDIKRIMVKIYANTLRINLTDSMVDSMTDNTITCTQNFPYLIINMSIMSCSVIEDKLS